MCNRLKGEMLMTDYALNKREKKSGAEKSGFSEPGPECPEKSGYSGKKSGLSGLQQSIRKNR
jgi:hypothetical protein